MDLARPALIVSLFLVATTLWYTGQWAGQAPRADDSQPHVVADSSHALARR